MAEGVVRAEEVRLRWTWITLLMLLASFSLSASDPVHTIKIEKKDKGNLYLDVLQFLVASSEGRLKLELVDLELTQAKEFALIKDGVLDLGHSGTSLKFEREFIPIRYPLLRGLSGYRLLMLHESLSLEFNEIDSVDALSKYWGVQGQGWVDAEILSQAGLRQRQTNWNNIYPMLAAGRRNYHAFGVLETFHKYDQFELKKTPIVVQRHLAIHYPFCVFFFVNKERRELAKTLGDVFERCYDDGSFLKFFYDHPYVSESLARASMEDRTVLHVDNALLSNKTKALPDHLFHDGLQIRRWVK